MLALYGALLIGGWYLGRSFSQLAESEPAMVSGPAVRMTILLAVAAFMLLSVLPLCRGFEIGIGLLMLFGAQIALMVYAAMVSALMLAYLMGRFVPARAVSGFRLPGV